MPLLTEARTTPGRRIYAIGDIHGCLNELREVQEWINADLSARPSEDWRVVYLGDYVDRGPDSAGVIAWLAERSAADARHLCLRGNHDAMFSAALGGEGRRISLWLENGGVETLESYGLTRDELERRLFDRTGFDDVIPPSHRSFLEGLHDMLIDGDYCFVHAGIDPDRPIDGQSASDLHWIREPFLSDTRDFGAVVIHGHTPVRRIEVQLNRIGIDTGAVFGGTLTCLCLEDARKARLNADGLRPLV